MHVLQQMVEHPFLVFYELMKLKQPVARYSLLSIFQNSHFKELNMLARFSLLLICLAFTTQATAEEVILFPDYKKGDSHVYEATVEINQTLSLNGMNIETAVSTMDERQLDVTKKSETST